ncbi:MAG: hypothetical protein WDN69_19015 [Aliidongia sp.]
MAQISGAVEPIRVCRFMHVALEELVQALEAAPETPMGKLGVLSPR